MKIQTITTIDNLAEETAKVISDETISKSQKMKTLFSYGFTIKEIASQLNVRYNFVYNVIQNQVICEGLEVESTKVSSKKETVRELFNQGKSTKEIAIDLKTNYNYIYKLVKEIKSEPVTVVNSESDKVAK